MSSHFFVLHWSTKLGFGYTDKEQWDSSVYQDDTLNTINSLNDHTGTAAYALFCCVFIPTDLIFLVGSLRMPRWKFGKYL